MYNQSEPNSSKPAYRKAITYQESVETTAKMLEIGAIKLAEYGSEILWHVHPEQVRILANFQNLDLTFQDKYNLVSLGGEAFDPLEGVPEVPSHLRQTRTDAPQMWVVQFIAPNRGEWLQQLTNQGIQPIAFGGTQAVVWVDDQQLKTLKVMVDKGENYLRWSGAYHPAYRLEADVLSLANNVKWSIFGSKSVAVIVSIYKTNAKEQTLKNLSKLSSKPLITSNDGNRVSVIVQIPENQIVNVASWSDVYYISLKRKRRLLDEGQNQIVAGNINTSGGNTTPKLDEGYLKWLRDKGFSDNVTDYPTVSIVDSGIDTGSNNRMLFLEYTHRL